MFGDFRCLCGRHWPSAYTWINWDSNLKKWVKSGQACKAKECKKKDDKLNVVSPHSIRPLLWSQGDRPKKEHLTKYCEKCKELGRDCRHYIPPEEHSDAVDIPDDVSVLSDSSSTDDAEEYRDDLTPVPSDEETTDDRLNRFLSSL